MNPTLAKALEYAATHGTTATQTARAIGVNPNTLFSAMAAAARSGDRVTWPQRPARSYHERHVRNGTAFWAECTPMGDPGRGPSPPVPPAPSDAAERHHTAAGIAWRLDVRPAVVELARRVLRLPALMTDAEADAIIRIIRGAAPSHTPDPPAPR
jgi:hypothetical protein